MLAREKVPALDVDADQRVPRRPRAREDVPDEVLHEDGRDRRGARQDLDASDVTEVRAQARGADGFSGAASEVVQDAPAVVAELAPFVRGKGRLSRPAGTVLALLVDDEDRAGELAKRLR